MRSEGLPRQNRPLVRDGRLQVTKKKRTDRSYLGGPARPPEQPDVEPGALVDSEPSAEDETGAAAALAPQPAPAASPHEPARTPAPARLPTSVRALQQQGVRRRRELDVDALAERDTAYAFHELRRILILATIVVVTLIVLGIVLR
jgi:hypothetical protein